MQSTLQLFYSAAQQQQDIMPVKGGKNIPNIENLVPEDVILVTGGTGLFGCAIRDIVEKYQLPGKWIFLGSKDGDLRNLEECKQLFNKHKPTYLIHLAAFVGGLFRNMQYKVKFWYDNVNMNNNVLQCANEHKVCVIPPMLSYITNSQLKKVVSCLSTCIFPDQVQYPISEADLHNGPPHMSNNAYAYAKRMLDMLGRWYNEQEGIVRFTSVIPTNLFGPNDHYNVESGHVLPGLMHKCLLAQSRLKMWRYLFY